MERLEGIYVAKVDENRRAIPETKRFVPCDTLLLSVGLIPENELAREAGIAMDLVTGGPLVDADCMTSVPGIFSCGNALHVHDLVDWVSVEAARAGGAAARFAARSISSASENLFVIRPGDGVRYVVPHTMGSAGAELSFRVGLPSKDRCIQVVSGGNVLYEKRHKRLHPAEIEHVTLGREEARALSEGDTLEVRVQ